MKMHRQGLILGSMVSQKYGRRLCMFVMSCYALVTATITVTSQSREQILAARILNCETRRKIEFLYQDLTLTDVYIGFELSVVPVYQSEIVPAPVRGFIVGTYQLSINVSIQCYYLGMNHQLTIT
jgi:MFS family permease